MFRKLYIIWYSEDFGGKNCSQYWANSEKEAIKKHEEDQGEGSQKDIIYICAEHEAIHKNDIQEAIERYITKPCLNKTMVTHSHTS